MPQNTNLNVSPYNDNFDENKNFRRVLFKPGTAIQARELTTLQTILQNQIERFGTYMFKEGAKVIPGQTGYDPRYEFVQIDPTFFGVPVSAYTEKLVGTEIVGETSGVKGKIVKVIDSEESERDNNTLYVRYLSASTNDFATVRFTNGERLITQDGIEYGLTEIKAGSVFATCISENATGTGSAAFIEEGIYFIRGFFVKVLTDNILLDQYGDKPSYRIGLLISEDIVTSFDDSSLNDNSQGFSNFTAPGADRFKLSTTFVKKDIDEFDDEDFIELMRVENGILLNFVKNTELNFIRDEFARRTADESGDYYVKAFEVDIKESLNNFDFNRGVYKENELTAQGNIPSEDLYCLQISPGKAYVQGFEVEKSSTTYLDVRKPETSNTIDTFRLPFNYGNKLELDNVSGSPPIGLGIIETLSLRSERVGINSLTAPGNEIGRARCFDFKLKDAAYSNKSTDFETFLYDIDTYTKITIGSNTTLSAPALIEGRSSGSKGFLNSTVTDNNVLTLNTVSGSFIVGEGISVNGISSAPTISSITDFSMDDVKSLFSTVGVSTFSADLKLTGIYSLGKEQLGISSASGGISTITGALTSKFAQSLRVGDIISYTRAGFSTVTFNKVLTIGTTLNSVTVSAISPVQGLYDGDIPAAAITVPVSLRIPELTDKQNAALYQPLDHVNISNINLDNSQLVYRKRYPASVTSNGCVIIESDVDSVFEDYDEEKYVLTYSNGQIEPLSSGKVSISPNGKTITFSQLTRSTDANAKLIATLRKIKINSKSKVLTRCEVLTIDKSSNPASGTVANTTLNDGLTYSPIYGLRIQDKEISIGKAEVLRVHAVFESDDNNNPNIPTLTLINVNGSLLEAAQGDQITGNSSFAIGRVVSTTSTTITFVFNNDREFEVGESVTLKLSQITGTISALTPGDKDIVKNSFTLDSGRRLEFLDFGRLIRKDSAPIPSKRLTIVYDYYSTPTSDDGEFFSYLSWPPRIIHDGIDLPRVNNDRLRESDMIDFRPRVKDYTNTNFSPFQYESREFPNNGSSVTTAPVTGESIVLGYSYRLPRTDKLILSKGGEFSIVSGEPSDNPLPPIVSENAFEVGTFTLRPYSYLAFSDIQFDKTKHKRYQMKDIGRLESRIRNVEFYTQLSLLESDTQNLSIKDPLTGLDRFKNGIFVDNFKSHGSHNIRSIDFKASTDASEGELRPSHYTTGLDLLIGSASAIGIGTTADSSVDLRFVTDLQNANIQRSGDLITLKYTEEKFIEQKFASRSENVNPFAVLNFVAVLELNPETDTWIEEKVLSPVTIEQQGNYAAMMDAFQIDPNTGLSPVDWGSWETTWTGETVVGETRIAKGTTPKSTEIISVEQVPGGPHGTSRTQTTVRDTFEDEYLLEIKVDTKESRSGIQRKITEQIDTVSLGTKIVGRELIPYCRERNIEFIAKRLRPSTQHYIFFNNVSMTEYCTPKFLQINMTQGVFKVGETVEEVQTSITSESTASESIKFRVAKANHKYGPYNLPDLLQLKNPYTGDPLGNNYSATSTILNVDTASLADITQNFKGRLKVGTKLIGKTSGAEATVSEIKFTADSAGTLIGCLYIPNAKYQTNPQFKTGKNTLRITAFAANVDVPGTPESGGEATFESSGQLDIYQETFLATRNAKVEVLTLNDKRTTSETVLQTETRERDELRSWIDPIAESIEIPAGEDSFITSVDVYFRTKDANIPITLQIRTMNSGLPSTTIYPFAEVSLEPSQINLSSTTSFTDVGAGVTTLVPTNFKFKSPVFLPAGEHAIVLISLSNSYNVWISRMNEYDVTTVANENEEKRVLISQQPYMGSLFKSQNGSTWDPSQYEDLKFTLYRAKFVKESGVFTAYNPTLSEANDKIVNLRNNPIFVLSKEVTVGLGTIVNPALVIPGVTISQLNNTSATGKVVKTSGAIGIGSTTIAVSNLTVNNVGSGVTPSTGQFYYSNVALTPVTGGGSGGLALVEVSGGSVGVITVTNGGTGYSVGDVVSVNLGATSQNVRLNVGVITGINQLTLTQQQGFFNTVDQLTSNSTTIPGAIPTVINTGVGDGKHITVKHRNHGMHSVANKVQLFRLQSDYTDTKLTAQYSSTATSNIPVESISIFNTFENVGVSQTNPGYVSINDEIISYTGVSGNNLSGITRGVDNTQTRTHFVGSAVSKYEFNGVSLRRINKVHDLGNATLPDSITIDQYKLKIDFSANGVDRSTGNAGGFQPLLFNISKIGGGKVARATQNIQFEAITPNVTYITPKETSLTARVRTVSGTSVSGTEVSFADQGFEPLQLGEINYFTSPRIIASQINETAKLTDLPGKKSFTMEMILNTKNTRVSPVIDLQRLSVITTTNRIDRIITDFSTDPRVNAVTGDPHAAVYVSKRVSLETPSTSLQVRLAAYRHPTNQIRVLYKLFRADLPDSTQPYILFPGFTNLKKSGTNAEIEYTVIDPSKNNGLPNDNVPASPNTGTFYDYLFSQENLPQFNGFMIKIIMTSTNQAYVPRIKELRAIALA